MCPAGHLLERESLWFDSCELPPPVSYHSVFAFWVVAHGRFDCIKNFDIGTLLMDRSQSIMPYRRPDKLNR